MADHTANMPNDSAGPRPSRSWVSRHRWGLIWTALLAAVVVVQWPMVKGMFYRVSGSPAPDDGIPWRADLDAALAESKQTGKPVLLDFWATWCPPCQVMKREVWPDARVRDAVMKGYIPVAVDVDRNADLAGRYGVSAIPNVLVLDSEGKVLRQANFLSSGGLLSFLAAEAGSPSGT